ncbi:MAG: hypothetical protein Q9170_005139 [Blastenia crenularia]
MGQEEDSKSLSREVQEDNESNTTPISTPSSGNGMDTSAPVDTLEEALYYLRAADDTSKFVGLARLRSILDNKQELREDPRMVTRCWAAVPSSFLGRLLRASQYKGNKAVDRDFMVGLGVAIIYTFANILPESSKDDEKLLGRTSELVAALHVGTSETIVQILQILLTLASTPRGSAALLKSDQWPAVQTMAVDHDVAFKVIEHAYAIAAASEALDLSSPLPRIHETISNLVNVSQGITNRILVFRCLKHLLLLVPENSTSPSWLSSLAELLLKSTTDARYVDCRENQQAISNLTVFLLRTYPLQFSNLLFRSPLKDYSNSRPLSLQFVESLFNDIKSFTPDIGKAQLDSAEYSSNYERLAVSYEILICFITFLVDASSALDVDVSNTLPYDPDQLAMLRDSLTHTCSTTIECLRYRYDAETTHDPQIEVSVADNPGLARMANDLLTLTQIRMLALWLCEDDSGTVKEETVGIIEIMLGLYQAEDFREPVLMIIEQLLFAECNIDALLHNKKGWETLIEDLASMVKSTSISVGRKHCGTLIVTILGPVISELMVRGGGSDLGLALFQMVYTLDTKGSPTLLDLKAMVVLLATRLFMDSRDPLLRVYGNLKQLLKVVKGLLATRNKLDPDRWKELDEARKDLTDLEIYHDGLLAQNIPGRVA